MFTDVDSVQLFFNTSTLLLISGFIILFAATYFVYKITIPDISPKIKAFLIVAYQRMWLEEAANRWVIIVIRVLSYITLKEF